MKPSKDMLRLAKLGAPDFTVSALTGWEGFEEALREEDSSFLPDLRAFCHYTWPLARDWDGIEAAEIFAWLREKGDAAPFPGDVHAELEALENFGACGPGRDMVEAWGSIELAYLYDDDAEIDWLRTEMIRPALGREKAKTLSAETVSALTIEAGEKREKCSDCGERGSVEDMFARPGDYNGPSICERCYCENYTTCERCGETCSSDYVSCVTLLEGIRDGRWRCEVDVSLCDDCRRDHEKEIEEAEQEKAERDERNELVAKATGFARWFARHFDGLDGRPRGADPETVAWIGTRSLGQVWEEIKTIGPNVDPDGFVSQARRRAERFVSNLTLNEHRDAILARFPGPDGKPVVSIPSLAALASTFTAREWARFGIETVRTFAAQKASP